MHNVSRPYIVNLVLCFFLIFFSNPVIANDLTALDILNRMKNTYSTSQSYIDKGIVSTLFIQSGKQRIVKKPFKTAFLRPDHYRFEFSERKIWGENHKFILHWDGKEANTFWDIQDPKVKKLGSLKEGISMSAGISGGSGRTVPVLLMPKKDPHGTFSNFTTLYKPKRVDDEVIEGIDCYKIKDPSDYRRLTLWISKEDFLLRQMYREQEFVDFDLEETTTYYPKINIDVPNQMLTFK